MSKGVAVKMRLLQFLVVLGPMMLLFFVLAPGAESNAASDEVTQVSDGVAAHTPVTSPKALADARRMQQLGVSLEMNGRLDEAVETQERALKTLQSALGADHPLSVTQEARVEMLHTKLAQG
jgi:hypothetical protein